MKKRITDVCKLKQQIKGTERIYMAPYINKDGKLVIEGDFSTTPVEDTEKYVDDWFSNTLNLDKDELIKLGIIDEATYVDGTTDYYKDDDLKDNEMGKPISKGEYDQYLKENTGDVYCKLKLTPYCN